VGCQLCNCRVRHQRGRGLARWRRSVKREEEKEDEYHMSSSSRPNKKKRSRKAGRKGEAGRDLPHCIESGFMVARILHSSMTRHHRPKTKNAGSCRERFGAPVVVKCRRVLCRQNWSAPHSRIEGTSAKPSNSAFTGFFYIDGSMTLMNTKTPQLALPRRPQKRWRRTPGDCVGLFVFQRRASSGITWG